VDLKHQGAGLGKALLRDEPSPSDPFHLFLLMKDIKAGV